MRAAIANVHERLLPAPAQRVGAMLDTLATAGDELWPVEHWPAMCFEGGLRLGARGGHGPVRYTVAQHVPGRLVRFSFSAPRGLDGDHWLEVVPAGDGATLLRHGLVATPRGSMRLQWRLVWGPLHDALLEDALARAARGLGGDPDTPRWSPWIRLLRRALG